MNNLSFELQNDDIIICPYEVKNYILLNSDQNLLNIKFIDKNELIKNLHFDYSLSAITYLSDKYHYSYSNSKEVLDNLKKINNFNEVSTKVKGVLSIYNDLKQNGLIEFNPYFVHLFKNRKIKIVGYSYLDKELINLIKSINSNNYEFIPFSVTEKKYQKCLKFNDIYEEVDALFNEICRLIDSGVSLNNIYLYQYNSDYNHLIERYKRYLNIKFSALRYPLNTLPIYNEFINGITTYDMDGLINSFNKIKNEFGKNEIKKLIVQIKDINVSRELLNFLSRNIYVNGDIYCNQISIIDRYIDLGEDDYLFIIGFTYGDFPKISKDTDFFSDKEKKELGINTSVEERDIENDLLQGLINSSKNIYLSYYLKKGRIENNISMIAEALGLNFVFGEKRNTRYSKKLAEIEVANLYDILHIYGESSDYLNTFTEKEISYNSYNNNYNGTLPRNDNNLKLSYSQIDEYNKCHFEYYLSRVLKLDSNNDTFFTKLGTIVHKVLEDSLTKTISKDDLIDYSNLVFLDAREKHFALLLADQVLDVINKNKEFINESNLKSSKAELDIKYQFDHNTMIEGKIDKVIYDSENKKAIIVDYKTGQFKFNKDKIPYGLGMQLLIYALLLENGNCEAFYKDLEILGIYIQKVLFDPTNKEERKEDHYLLNGLTIGDKYEVLFIDPNIVNKSKYLKGIKMTIKNELYSDSFNYGYMISRSDFNELKEETKKQIKIAISGIRNGNFEINPVRFDGDHEYCQYCNFGDICYKRRSNVKIINLKENA